MTRQYFNENSKSYRPDPWTVDDIKYFDNIREIFETNETIKEFDSAKYEINVCKIPAQGWFDYDGEISTIDEEAFEFWQDLAITYEVMKEHEENIERGKYSEEEIAKYEEEKDYFEKNDDLQAISKFGFDLPEYNKNIYLVKGTDKYDYKGAWMFEGFVDAEAYANKIDGKLYKVNKYELYKAAIELKQLDDVRIELKRDEDNIKEIFEDDLVEFDTIDAYDLI